MKERFDGMEPEAFVRKHVPDVRLTWTFLVIRSGNELIAQFYRGPKRDEWEEAAEWLEKRLAETSEVQEEIDLLRAVIGEIKGRYRPRADRTDMRLQAILADLKRGLKEQP